MTGLYKIHPNKGNDILIYIHLYFTILFPTNLVDAIHGFDIFSVSFQLKLLVR